MRIFYRLWRWFLGLTDKELKREIDVNLRHFPFRKEAEENPVFQDPGAKEQGLGYQPQWRATIYPDSEVLTPYLGSAQEEAASLIKPKSAADRKSGTTCPSCYGWGCYHCGGRGSI